jgi:hypothetical protein
MALVCSLLFVPALLLQSGTPVAEAAGETNDYFSTSEYAENIWSDHADTSWYDSNKDASVYTINTASELAGLAVLVTKQDVDFSGKTIQLGRDIDLKGHQWFPIGCDVDNYWMSSPFRGTFDGRGHTIRNLHIKNSWHGQALFGYAEDATIENFTVSGSVTTGWQAAGVIAEMERTQLLNITNYCDVKTLFKSGDNGYSSTAGGIVAYVADTYVTRNGAHASSLTNLKNYGSVECAGITEQGGGVGGIAGSLLVSDDDQTITVSQCENYGDVYCKASNYNDIYAKGTGGIVGSTATYGNYQISDSANHGSVASANLASTGGVVGSLSGLSSSVSYCYNSGSVEGQSPESAASTGGIVGRSVASHTGSTQLDLVSCYNVGKVTGRGGNVSAILGAQSGYGEDWEDNAGGTTVNNVSNYYAEDSVSTSSQTGVLFQSGMVEAAQPVSMDRINSQEVIDDLNSTDEKQDHYAEGKTSPKLDLKSSTDVGLDKSSKSGEGAEEDTTISEDNPAEQKETHMYEIQADQSDSVLSQINANLTIVVLVLVVLLLIAASVIYQLGDYRKQKRKLKAVARLQRG